MGALSFPPNTRFGAGIVAVLCFFYTAGGLSKATSSATPAPTESMSIGGAAINVEIEPGDLNLSRTQILDWV